MKNVLKRVMIGTAMALSLSTVGGVVIPSLAPIEAKAYSNFVRMQSIYHDDATTVEVLFKADESLSYYVDANMAYIHVQNVDTGVITRYKAERQSTNEDRESEFKAVFTHGVGERVKVKLEFITPSSTGHPQSIFDDNNGYWYQCHSWN